MSDNDLYTVPELAERYATVTASNIWNAEYERPAMRALLGEVADLDVLDAGCAAGETAKWLSAAGARVTAIDVSRAMVDIATRNLGGRARVMQMDLGESLEFPDNAFDIIASSLTLHYLASWDKTLAEFKRILRPGGRLVFSTHHPYLTVEEKADYHDIRLVIEQWGSFGPEPVAVRFYHRPLKTILNDVIDAGFILSRIAEPGNETLLGHDPAISRRLGSQPWFMLVEARKGAN